jgi:hypothetical protein
MRAESCTRDWAPMLLGHGCVVDLRRAPAYMLASLGNVGKEEEKGEETGNHRGRGMEGGEDGD